MFEQCRTADLTSKAPNDCAIVALTFATGKTYDEIRSELVAIAISINHQWKFWKGTPHLLTDEWFKRNGYKQVAIPRANNRKMITGIASVHKAGAKSGHMVCFIGGLAFDSNYKTGIDAVTYCNLFGYHVRQLWMKG